nr:hypothetical protein [Abalone asfa-like virus]
MVDFAIKDEKYGDETELMPVYYTTVDQKLYLMISPLRKYEYVILVLKTAIVDKVLLHDTINISSYLVTDQVNFQVFVQGVDENSVNPKAFLVTANKIPNGYAFPKPIYQEFRKKYDETFMVSTTTEKPQPTTTKKPKVFPSTTKKPPTTETFKKIVTTMKLTTQKEILEKPSQHQQKKYDNPPPPHILTYLCSQMVNKI